MSAVQTKDNHILDYNQDNNMEKQDDTSTPSTKSQSSETPSTRWWESYLVRYFIGFIVGCACVIIVVAELGLFDLLLKHLSSTNPVSGKPDWSTIAILIAFLGIGYCYIASTPITVLHVGRYDRGWIDSQSRYFWLSWVVIIALTLLGFSQKLGQYPGHEWFALIAACGTIWVLEKSKIK